MSLVGHYWTIAPRLHPLPPEPPFERWETTVEDPDLGPVRLGGRWSEHPEATEAVLVIHGISGCSDSRYARLGAAAALEAGMSCLRLDLRGSDRRGEDYYHAGLSSDLAAALAHPALERYERLYVLGYSLGGHLALKLAGDGNGDGKPVPRLAAVAALCAPLDLAAGQRAIDKAAVAVYRLYALRGLKQIYAAVAQRRPVPIPVAEARRVTTLWEWDERVVAPRWGFAGAADYYARASAGAVVERLGVPALLVVSEDDPMVPPSTVRPVLERLEAPRLTVRWLRGGGHLGFPNGQGLPGASPAVEAGLDAQVLAWLRGAGDGR